MQTSRDAVRAVMMQDEISILKQALYEIKDAPLSREEMIQRAEKALHEIEWGDYKSDPKYLEVKR
jgi:hypothetical protein